MKTLFSTLRRTLSQGEGAVFVTVIASSGSTPRGAGARMLVGQSGEIAGTVGGGAVEYRCIDLARQLLCSPHPAQQQLTLDLTEHASLGMVCGGQVDIHFLPIPAGDAAARALCDDACARFAAGSPFWLATPLVDDAPLVLWPSRDGCPLPSALQQKLHTAAARRLCWEKRWFCEQLQGAGAVYLFGGGHVAQALVPVLAPLDFPCVVLEDRQEFADPARFPLARAVRQIDFSKLDDALSLSQEDYVCIMTRGHENDLLIAGQILNTPARYIGMIGSRKKAAVTHTALAKLGFLPADIARIITPIGLPIGGETPAEIAISIAGQLIAHRYGHLV